MDLSVIENDPKEVKKYLQNFVPINYYRVLDDAYLYQVRAILLHSVSHADSYNPIYAGLINDLTVTVGNNQASYKTSIKSVVDNVSVLITKTEKLEADTYSSNASIESIQEVYAADREARATEVKTLTAAIKDIVIGGRNIMINSDFSRGYREWQEASIEPLDHFIGKLFKVRSTGIVGSLMGIYPLEEFQNMAMVEGTQYSVSFYAYGSILLMDEIYLTSATEAPIKLPSVVISTDLSERRHITFKAPTGGGGLGLIIGATATKKDDWFNIGKVKVELGNRPSDWTPAPEDVDGYIARVQSVITEFRDVQVKDNESKAKLIEKLDSRVDENAATVTRELETQVTKHDALAKRTETVEANTKGNKAKIEDVEIAFTDEKSATAKRLSTLEAASALGEGKITTLEKVTADTDKIVAEQSTTLNAKIDNISSGGRNLLKNADFKLGVDTWGTSKITKAKNILGNLLTVTNTGTTTDYYGLQPVDIFRNIKLLEGKEYVLSFYAKGNIPTINDIWITSKDNLPQQLSNAKITSGIADRTEIVFIAKNTSEESSLIIGANGYAKDSWFAVVAVKIELGNKATDWTIAPEDTGEIIEQVEANIESYKKAQALINLATTESYERMEASVGENKGELERLDSLVVTNTDAIGTINTKLEVDIGGNIAKIIEDYKVVSSEVGAMGTKLDGVYAQTNPVMMGNEEVMIGSEQHYAGVWTETGARIEQGLAQSFRSDALEASIGANRALIKEEEVTRVNAIGSLSALTTSIQANTNNNTAEIEKLMVTVTTPTSGLSAVVTELKAVVAENTNVGKATKKAAEDAAILAGNKGEVIFSNVAPSADKQLPQNLWIDTSEDLNTPKRWAGGKWLVVTDFAARTAQLAANKANALAEKHEEDMNPIMIGNEEYKLGNEEILIGKKTIYHASEQALENFKPQNLSKIVEGSGAFATEFGAIAGKYSKMEGVIAGQKGAIEIYNSVGNLEALKNEIAKERLNKNIEGLDAQKGKLTTAIADYTAQITLLNTKIVATEDVEVKDEYRNQISKLQAAIVNANAEKSIIDDNKRQLATEVRQLKDLEIVKDKILLESGIKLTGPKGKVKGIGLLMEDTGFTNFDIIVDSFSMSVDETSTSIKPFKVNGTGFEVNVPLKANSTITTPSIQGGSITGTSININNKFKVSAQGDLIATSGTFGGIVTGGSINIADKFKVDSSGHMTATSGTFSGDITGASGTFNGTVYANMISGKVANIEVASIDTLQIRGNAVTIPRVQYFSNVILLNNLQNIYSQTFGNISLDVKGGDVSISVVFDYIDAMKGGPENSTCVLKVEYLRGSIVLDTFTRTFDWAGNFRDIVRGYSYPTILDVKPPSGTNTYSIRVSYTVDGRPVTVSIGPRSIHIFGAKR